MHYTGINQDLQKDSHPVEDLKNSYILWSSRSHSLEGTGLVLIIQDKNQILISLYFPRH